MSTVMFSKQAKESTGHFLDGINLLKEQDKITTLFKNIRRHSRKKNTKCGCTPTTESFTLLF